MDLEMIRKAWLERESKGILMMEAV